MTATLLAPRSVMVPIPPVRANRPAITAIANAKGGVGKTSIAANIAGIAAASGWQVLLVDLDPQGNLAIDLGYKDRSDQGASLAAVFRHAGEPDVLRAVRPGLDVWPGGPALLSTVQAALIPEVTDPLSEALRATGATYDAVFIDCPPALGPLVDAALVAADFLLVPIRADHASLDGLSMISDRFHQVRQVNTTLELLGVTLFDVSRTATALVRDIAAALNRTFGGEEPRALPAIRRSERTAYELRHHGRLAHEHAAQAPADAAAANLARDYAALAEPVLAIMNARRLSPPSGADPGGR